MFEFLNRKANAERLLSYIEDFELFCMGKKKMSPQEFMELNEELSISAVLSIGSHRFETKDDGRHLIWRGLDGREHDLGLADQVNVLRDYPGFHRTRTLSLAHGLVQNNTTMDVPLQRRQLSVVELKDGSIGIAPNYKLALRNAALRKHVTSEFNRNSSVLFWRQADGNA
jgi:hypothetical protein